MTVMLPSNPGGIAPGNTAGSTTPEITPAVLIVKPGGNAPDTNVTILSPYMSGL